MFYDLIDVLCRPAAWWGRLRVEGIEFVPETGPLLVVSNHDSQWDPILVGLAIGPRRRLRFLARASLWQIPGLRPILNGLGQIPLRRGAGDPAGLDRAIDALRAGEAIGVFPEGQLSWGEHLRSRSGVARLSAACPTARVVLCAIEGSTDYVRFPRRPRITVTFFAPRTGDPPRGDAPAAQAARWLSEIRERVLPAAAGRRPTIGGPPRVRRRLARNAEP